jgi:hypothetical protein
MCGAARYRVTGTPANSMVCHCRSCRRAAGAPVVAWVTFAAASFEWLHGETVTFNSSDPVRRTFCPRCGTQLTYEHRHGAGTIDVTTCSLDNPEAFPPTHHSWMSHGVAWFRVDDGLPAFPEWRPHATS